MTINEAISIIDERYSNNMPAETKVNYLSRLDHLVAKRVMKKEDFSGYTATTPRDVSLLVGEPYTDIYIFWLQAWIDYWNEEYEKYNTAISMYQAIYEAFAKDYQSTHTETHQFKFY